MAQRVKCEDFDSFETGFKAVHAGLKSGKYRLIKFKEAHVAPGRYFVEDGILVYIAGMDQIEKIGTEERMAVHVASMKRHGVGHLYADTLQELVSYGLYGTRLVGCRR